MEAEREHRPSGSSQIIHEFNVRHFEELLNRNGWLEEVGLD